MKIITFIAMATLLSFSTAGFTSQHEAGEQGQHKRCAHNAGMQGQHKMCAHKACMQGQHKMCAHKSGMQGKMRQKRAMHHANPMPNLMMVVMKKSDELNLTADQQKALAAWREKSSPIFKQQVGKVMMLEKEIMSASLEGMDEAALMSKVDEMLAVRRDIAERKVNCRDNLKKILNEEQYNTVITTYQQHRAAKHQKMGKH